MIRMSIWLIAPAFVFLLSTAESRGQAFNGGGVAFAPEISVVESGAKLDTQATVSADRKYVTLTMRPQVAQLIALRDFVFQSGNGGPVGIGSNAAGGNPNNGGGAAGAGNRPASSRNGVIMPALVKPVAPTPALLQEGMQRVDRPAQR